MKIIKLIIFTGFICQSISILANERNNFNADAQKFIKESNISTNDATTIANYISSFFDMLKKTGSSLGDFQKKLDNKSVFEALGKSFNPQLENLKGPLGDFLAQLQAYYLALSLKLQTEGKANSLKSLNLN